MAAGDSSGYALAFSEGKATVFAQAQTLKETRDRAGTLVSAAGLVAGLVTGLGFSDSRVNRLGPWSIFGGGLAGIGFVVLVVGAVMIWRPMKGVFALHSGVLVGSYVEGDPPADIAEMHRQLALHLGLAAEHNRVGLNDRLEWFTTSLWAFLLEVGGLAIILIDVATK